MLQRPAPTPFVRVLLSVAVYAALLTMVGRAAVCRAAGELKDACTNYEVSAAWGRLGARAVYIIHQRCSYSPFAIRLRIKLYLRQSIMVCTLQTLHVDTHSLRIALHSFTLHTLHLAVSDCCGVRGLQSESMARGLV